MEYLTEEKLYEYLSKTFPQYIWIRNKRFLNYKIRPDIQCPELKVIIEFDGYRHFTTSKVQEKDIEKDTIVESHGYRIIRIPYFVQIHKEIIEKILGYKINFNIEQTYPHGFIDKKALLPADFNQAGYNYFKYLLNVEYKYISEKIIKSLFDKVEELGNYKLVFPPSDWNIFNEE